MARARTESVAFLIVPPRGRRSPLRHYYGKRKETSVMSVTPGAARFPKHLLVCVTSPLHSKCPEQRLERLCLFRIVPSVLIDNAWRKRTMTLEEYCGWRSSASETTIVSRTVSARIKIQTLDFKRAT